MSANCGHLDWVFAWHYYLIYISSLGRRTVWKETRNRFPCLSSPPLYPPPPPSRYIWNRLPVTVIWISILTSLRKTRGLWIVYASLSYCSEEDCTGLCINFWSVSFLIFLFLALADLSMGKKGALGKIFRITSRTLVFYNARLPKLLLKLMRKKIQTDETEQKQLKHRILVNL